MPSDRLPVSSNYGLRAGFSIHSESPELSLLRLENQQLRDLVIQLSKIVFKNVMDPKRPR